MYSPLEQFSIIQYLPFSYNNIIFSLTNSSFVIIISFRLFIYFLYVATKKGGYLIPSYKQSLAELMFEFISNLIEEQIGEKGKKFFPFIFTLFHFILIFNVMGMIPYSFTVTSHFIITFMLSFSVFITVTLTGFRTHGLHFFSFLLPPGAPLILAPLLVVLELVSYSFRAISLGVRLFANMMAGHTLVKILAGFTWSMMCIGGIMSTVSLIPMGIIFALTGLELGVAFLQAYVFTILTCIYLNDALNLH